MSVEVYNGHDPAELRKNWRQYHPPLVPIFYMELDEMKKLFNMNERAVHPVGLQVMIGFFEEYEKYEHAAVVRDVLFRMGLFTEEIKRNDTLDQAADGEVFVDEILEKVTDEDLATDENQDSDSDDEDDIDIYNLDKNPFE